MRILTVLLSTNCFLTQLNLKEAVSKVQPVVCLITNKHFLQPVYGIFFKKHTHAHKGAHIWL